jgi:hypothetical protein
MEESLIVRPEPMMQADGENTKIDHPQAQVWTFWKSKGLIPRKKGQGGRTRTSNLRRVKTALYPCLRSGLGICISYSM